MPKFADVNVGDELPTLVKHVSRAQLVLYCAGSGDFNPLHWDQSFPQAQAIGDNIIHGRMKFASLGELVSNWMEHSGWVRQISCQYRGMDMQDTTITCKGKVTAKREEGGRKLVDLEIWTENAEGKATTPGTATVALNA
jgi:acyl dehydratase